MDRFTIPVKEKIVAPIVLHEKIRPVIEANGIDLDDAEYSLYRNPEVGEELSEGVRYTAGSGLNHTARLNKLRELRPKNLDDFIGFCIAHNRAPPVIKISQEEKRPVVVKTAHTQATLRYESLISQLMAQLGVGPQYLGGDYINPRAFVIVEKYVSQDTGFDPIFLHSRGREAVKEIPQLLGDLVGKMQGYHDVRVDGTRLEGHYSYKIRMLPHLYYNPKTNTLMLLDFGQGELHSFRGKLAKRKEELVLVNEAVGAANMLLTQLAYPFLSGVSARHPSMETDAGILKTFSSAYTKQSGIPLEVELRDVIHNPNTLVRKP